MDREPVEETWISALVLWWRYESGYQYVKGYPKECPSTRDYRTSRQYDDMGIPDRDGIIREPTADTDARGREAKRVGNIVNSLPEPYRTALYTLARNRATGVTVWKSPRLPQDDTQRARVVADALEMFGVLL